MAFLAVPAPAPALAVRTATEHVVVYGTLPDSDIGLSSEKVPGLLQSFSADRVTAQHGATVLDALGTQAAGVSLTDTQGNAMFQDLRFHGFEASPLQGTPQGIAVYQNGARLNEAFGDTVNWDAIPQAAIARLDVWSSNPVFGLNALGGSVNLVMKNGFTWQAARTPRCKAAPTAMAWPAAAMGPTSPSTLVPSVFMARPKASPMQAGGFIPQSNLGRLYTDAGWRFGNSEIHLVASGVPPRYWAWKLGRRRST